MITIFSVPKSFRGHIDVIQRNAIQSWKALRPACEIILFGDDQGTAEAEEEFGVIHVPEVARNELGTPLVNDVFARAEELAKNDLLCYVNADIMLLDDFIPAVQIAAQKMKSFLMVGRRWDLDIEEPWDLGQPGAESRLRQLVSRRGKLHGEVAIDYFVFPRSFWSTIPPFAIGRTTWDNWLIYEAYRSGAPVIDATGCITAVHQNHGYGHAGADKRAVWEGPEAKRNLELAGGRAHAFDLNDATHKMYKSGVKRDMSLPRLIRRIRRFPAYLPGLSRLEGFARVIAMLSAPLRKKLGLAASQNARGNNKP